MPSPAKVTVRQTSSARVSACRGGVSGELASLTPE
jgi:hypothetical protein